MILDPREGDILLLSVCKEGLSLYLSTSSPIFSPRRLSLIVDCFLNSVFNYKPMQLQRQENTTREVMILMER